MLHDTASARIAELEDDNRRLRRLLDSRDAPGELRHRARSTLALLRSIVRKSAEGRRDLADYVSQLEDRLDSLGRTQLSADANGFVDLHTLIADELFFYRLSEGERLSLSGPVVRFAPRAGQTFGLAIHELAVNALEHGAGSAGRIGVAWEVAKEGRDSVLIFTWSEDGSEQVAAPSRTGFGTDVLTRMLDYELRAETTIAYGETGFRCAIRIPLDREAAVVLGDDLAKHEGK